MQRTSDYLLLSLAVSCADSTPGRFCCCCWCWCCCCCEAPAAAAAAAAPPTFVTPADKRSLLLLDILQEGGRSTEKPMGGLPRQRDILATSDSECDGAHESMVCCTRRWHAAVSLLTAREGQLRHDYSVRVFPFDQP